MKIFLILFWSAFMFITGIAFTIHSVTTNNESYNIVCKDSNESSQDFLNDLNLENM